MGQEVMMKVKKCQRGQGNSTPSPSGRPVQCRWHGSVCGVHLLQWPSPPLPQTGVSHVSAWHPRLDSMDLPRVTDAEGGGVHRALGGRRHPLGVPCLSTEDRQEEQEREERLDVAGYNRRLSHASC